MHQTFEKFSRKPNEIDEIISVETRKAKFSTVFKHLFPPVGNYSESMQSYLKLLPEFEFHIELLIKEQLVVDRLYKENDIKRRKDGVYRFWVFLVKMYHTLTDNKALNDRCERSNFDNIFAFMNGFPIEKTRVVIIGQDPSEKCESYGYAFHGSNCSATHDLVRYFFNNDRPHLENAGKIGGGPEHSQTNFNGKLFNLNSWIKQGVLLFNTYLTFGEHSKELWLNFTRFLVKQLSSESDCLVFILACGDANNKLSSLINLEKHKVINVYHPSHPSQTREDLRWDIQLPYLEANEYYFRKQKPFMIDWESVGGRSFRLERYKTYFESLPSNEVSMETESRDETDES